jgi:hypothetical protein
MRRTLPPLPPRLARLRFAVQRTEPAQVEAASLQILLDEVRKVRLLVAAEGNAQSGVKGKGIGQTGCTSSIIGQPNGFVPNILPDAGA